MSRFAFDIETVSPDVPHNQRPDFDDSGDFEFLISAVGYQPEPGADVETELFFRDGWGPEAELEVIEATLEWFGDRATDGDTLFTYNGARFDLVHLEGRAIRAAGDADTGTTAVVQGVKNLLGRLEHDDIRDDARAAYGGYPTLEAACERNNVDVDETPLVDYGLSLDRLNETRSSKSRGKDHVVSEDVPVLGEEYLDLVDDGETDSEAFESLRAALDHYARADIRPLFRLADERPFAAAPDAR